MGFFHSLFKGVKKTTKIGVNLGTFGQGGKVFDRGSADAQHGLSAVGHGVGQYGHNLNKFYKGLFLGGLQGGYLNDAYKGTVSGPRKAQELRQAQDQRLASDAAFARSSAASSAVLGQGQGALRDVRSGFQSALSQIDPLKQNELRQVNEQGAGALAATQQSAVSRGLYNTSLLEDSKRGVGAETSRAIASIEGRYAGIKASLEAGQAGAIGDVQQQIATQTAQAGANASAILQNRGNALAGINYQDPRAYLDSLLGIAGTAAGIYYGQKKPQSSTNGGVV